jgi:hypothetical protein
MTREIFFMPGTSDGDQLRSDKRVGQMKFNYKHLRVGLIGVGLEAYWEQFEGLEARLLGYLSEIEQTGGWAEPDSVQPRPCRYSAESH